MKKANARTSHTFKSLPILAFCSCRAGKRRKCFLLLLNAIYMLPQSLVLLLLFLFYSFFLLFRLVTVSLTHIHTWPRSRHMQPHIKQEASTTRKKTSYYSYFFSVFACRFVDFCEFFVSLYVDVVYFVGYWHTHSAILYSHKKGHFMHTCKNNKTCIHSHSLARFLAKICCICCEIYTRKSF